MSWTAERLSQLATGYWSSQVLMTAVQLGVFDALPGETGPVCSACGLDLRTGGMLLEALGGMGLLVRSAGGGWQAAEGVGPLLQRRSPTSLAPALELNAAMAGMWSKLPELVKTGRPVVPPGAHLGGDPERTRGFVLAMEARGRAVLPAVVSALPLDGVSTLLDVGSGAGTLGRLLVERDPRLRVTLLDLPAVTDVARTLTTAHPHAGRITHLAADYLTAVFPGPFDAVVWCGAMHQHDRAKARELVAKLAAAARPGGGRVIVVDLMAGTGLPGGFSELFALNMALVSPVARVHTPSEVRDDLQAAGLGDITDAPATAADGTAIYHIVSGVRG